MRPTILMLLQLCLSQTSAGARDTAPSIATDKGGDIIVSIPEGANILIQRYNSDTGSEIEGRWPVATMEDVKAHTKPLESRVSALEDSLERCNAKVEALGVEQDSMGSDLSDFRAELNAAIEEIVASVTELTSGAAEGCQLENPPSAPSGGYMHGSGDGPGSIRLFGCNEGRVYCF